MSYNSIKIYVMNLMKKSNKTTLKINIELEIIFLLIASILRATSLMASLNVFQRIMSK